ncbi:hypothetical protein OCU04_004959 [Sclerotinia nivalis]|uniref:Uncharacterized protein n=1 Tax=Sclerotinia nivalis TaxID=352851 RepID=A0A9X0AN78_9HELO|nr:hypothetical protein OCU04_004959 [Sclerotinia nivalis]
MPNATQEKITLLLQSSPYHIELLQIEKDYRASHKPILAQTKKSLTAYRVATRAGNTAAAQECQDNIDQNVHKMVDIHKEKKREWDIVIGRLGEDVGGLLGRTLTDVARELGGSGAAADGNDMNLEKVLAEVVKRMHSE